MYNAPDRWWHAYHGKGFGGHADSVFNENQGRNHGNTLFYARTRLLQSSFSHSVTDTVHVAEDASESAFITYPGADEIVAGSPQNSVYMYMYITFEHYASYEVMTSLDFSSHNMTAGYGYCSKLMYS